LNINKADQPTKAAIQPICRQNSTVQQKYEAMPAMTLRIPLCIAA
jgi:hypothetical protein